MKIFSLASVGLFFYIKKNSRNPKTITSIGVILKIRNKKITITINQNNNCIKISILKLPITTYISKL